MKNSGAKRTHEGNLTTRCHDERGESLPGVLVAVAISAIAAAGVSAAVSNVFQSTNTVKSHQAMNKFQDSIRGTTSQLFRYFAMAGCYQTPCDPTYGDDQAYKNVCTDMGGDKADRPPGNTTDSKRYSDIFTAANLPLATLNASLSFVNSITLPSSPYISSTDKGMGQAAARCASPVIAGTLGSGEYYRFCLKTNQPSGMSVSKDSFWYSPDGKNNEFIEVLIVPVSLPGDIPIKCEDFTKSKQNGLKIMYSEYRYRKVTANKDSPGDVRQQNGTFYVSGVPEPIPPPSLPNVYCAQGPGGSVNIISLDKNEALQCMSKANSTAFKAGCEGDTNAKLSVQTCNQFRADVGWQHKSRVDAGRCIRFNPLKCYQASPKKWNN